MGFKAWATWYENSMSNPPGSESAIDQSSTLHLVAIDGWVPSIIMMKQQKQGKIKSLLTLSTHPDSSWPAT